VRGAVRSAFVSGISRSAHRATNPKRAPSGGDDRASRAPGYQHAHTLLNPPFERQWHTQEAPFGFLQPHAI